MTYVSDIAFTETVKTEQSRSVWMNKISPNRAIGRRSAAKSLPNGQRLGPPFLDPAFSAIIVTGLMSPPGKAGENGFFNTMSCCLLVG